jgi:peroxin-5
MVQTGRKTSRWAINTLTSENENEQLAILALQNSVKQSNSSHLEASLALAVSYANENNLQGVRESLFSWIKAHPSYQVSNQDDIIETILQAARSRPDDVDPDVQVALGILFNVSSEFEKAIDCFGAALSKRPNVC